MSASATVTRSVNSGGKTLTSSVEYTGDARNDLLAVPVADSVTDQLHALVIDFSQIKMFYMQSTVDMTAEFNNSGAGVPQIDLKAGIPFIWTPDDAHYVNLFTSDITALYMTNASGGAGEFTVLSVIDPTV